MHPLATPRSSSSGGRRTNAPSPVARRTAAAGPNGRSPVAAPGKRWLSSRLPRDLLSVDGSGLRDQRAERGRRIAATAKAAMKRTMVRVRSLRFLTSSPPCRGRAAPPRWRAWARSRRCAPSTPSRTCASPRCSPRRGGSPSVSTRSRESAAPRTRRPRRPPASRDTTDRRSTYPSAPSPRRAIAIEVIPIFRRKRRSRMPAEVTSSPRRLQRPASPPAKASRNADPMIIPIAQVELVHAVADGQSRSAARSKHVADAGHERRLRTAMRTSALAVPVTLMPMTERPGPPTRLSAVSLLQGS